MNPKHSQVQGGKRTTSIERLRAGAVCAIQQAIAMREEAMAMKEEALEMRLRLWLTRLDEQRLDTSRDKAFERALDAADGSSIIQTGEPRSTVGSRDGS